MEHKGSPKVRQKNRKPMNIVVPEKSVPPIGPESSASTQTPLVTPIVSPGGFPPSTPSLHTPSLNVRPFTPLYRLGIFNSKASENQTPLLKIKDERLNEKESQTSFRLDSKKLSSKDSLSDFNSQMRFHGGYGLISGRQLWTPVNERKLRLPNSSESLAEGQMSIGERLQYEPVSLNIFWKDFVRSSVSIRGKDFDYICQMERFVPIESGDRTQAVLSNDKVTLDPKVLSSLDFLLNVTASSTDIYQVDVARFALYLLDPQSKEFKGIKAIQKITAYLNTMFSFNDKQIPIFSEDAKALRFQRYFEKLDVLERYTPLLNQILVLIPEDGSDLQKFNLFYAEWQALQNLMEHYCPWSEILTGLEYLNQIAQSQDASNEFNIALQQGSLKGCQGLKIIIKQYKEATPNARHLSDYDCMLAIRQKVESGESLGYLRIREVLQQRIGPFFDLIKRHLLSEENPSEVTDLQAYWIMRYVNQNTVMPFLDVLSPLYAAAPDAELCPRQTNVQIDVIGPNKVFVKTNSLLLVSTENVKMGEIAGIDGIMRFNSDGRPANIDINTVTLHSSLTKRWVNPEHLDIGGGDKDKKYQKALPVASDHMIGSAELLRRIFFFQLALQQKEVAILKRLRTVNEMQTIVNRNKQGHEQEISFFGPYLRQLQVASQALYKDIFTLEEIVIANEKLESSVLFETLKAYCTQRASSSKSKLFSALSEVLASISDSSELTVETIIERLKEAVIIPLEALEKTFANSLSPFYESTASIPKFLYFILDRKPSGKTLTHKAVELYIELKNTQQFGQMRACLHALAANDGGNISVPIRAFFSALLAKINDPKDLVFIGEELDKIYAKPSRKDWAAETIKLVLARYKQLTVPHSVLSISISQDIKEKKYERNDEEEEETLVKSPSVLGCQAKSIVRVGDYFQQKKSNLSTFQRAKMEMDWDKIKSQDEETVTPSQIVTFERELETRLFSLLPNEEADDFDPLLLEEIKFKFLQKFHERITAGRASIDRDVKSVNNIKREPKEKSDGQVSNLPEKKQGMPVSLSEVEEVIDANQEKFAYEAGELFLNALDSAEFQYEFKIRGQGIFTDHLEERREGLFSAAKRANARCNLEQLLNVKQSIVIEAIIVIAKNTANDFQGQIIGPLREEAEGENSNLEPTRTSKFRQIAHNSQMRTLVELISELNPEEGIFDFTFELSDTGILTHSTWHQTSPNFQILLEQGIERQRLRCEILQLKANISLCLDIAEWMNHPIDNKDKEKFAQVSQALNNVNSRQKLDDILLKIRDYQAKFLQQNPTFELAYSFVPAFLKMFSSRCSDESSSDYGKHDKIKEAASCIAKVASAHHKDNFKNIIKILYFALGDKDDKPSVATKLLITELSRNHPEIYSRIYSILNKPTPSLSKSISPFRSWAAEIIKYAPKPNVDSGEHKVKESSDLASPKPNSIQDQPKVSSPDASPSLSMPISTTEQPAVATQPNPAISFSETLEAKNLRHIAWVAFAPEDGKVIKDVKTKSTALSINFETTHLVDSVKTKIAQIMFRMEVAKAWGISAEFYGRMKLDLHEKIKTLPKEEEAALEILRQFESNWSWSTQKKRVAPLTALPGDSEFLAFIPESMESWSASLSSFRKVKEKSSHKSYEKTKIVIEFLQVVNRFEPVTTKSENISEQLIGSTFSSQEGADVPEPIRAAVEIVILEFNYDASSKEINKDSVGCLILAFIMANAPEIGPDKLQFIQQLIYQLAKENSFAYAQAIAALEDIAAKQEDNATLANCAKVILDSLDEARLVTTEKMDQDLPGPGMDGKFRPRTDESLYLGEESKLNLPASIEKRKLALKKGDWKVKDSVKLPGEKDLIESKSLRSRSAFLSLLRREKPPEIRDLLTNTETIRPYLQNKDWQQFENWLKAGEFTAEEIREALSAISHSSTMGKVEVEAFKIDCSSQAWAETIIEGLVVEFQILCALEFAVESERPKQSQTGQEQAPPSEVDPPVQFKYKYIENQLKNHTVDSLVELFLNIYFFGGEEGRNLVKKFYENCADSDPNFAWAREIVGKLSYYLDTEISIESKLVAKLLDAVEGIVLPNTSNPKIRFKKSEYAARLKHLLYSEYPPEVIAGAIHKMQEVQDSSLLPTPQVVLLIYLRENAAQKRFSNILEAYERISKEGEEEEVNSSGLPDGKSPLGRIVVEYKGKSSSPTEPKDINKLSEETTGNLLDIFDNTTNLAPVKIRPRSHSARLASSDFPKADQKIARSFSMDDIYKKKGGSGHGSPKDPSPTDLKRKSTDSLTRDPLPADTKVSKKPFEGIKPSDETTPQNSAQGSPKSKGSDGYSENGFPDTVTLGDTGNKASSSGNSPRSLSQPSVSDPEEKTGLLPWLKKKAAALLENWKNLLGIAVSCGVALGGLSATLIFKEYLLESLFGATPMGLSFWIGAMVVFAVAGIIGNFISARQNSPPSPKPWLVGLALNVALLTLMGGVFLILHPGSLGLLLGKLGLQIAKDSLLALGTLFLTASLWPSFSPASPKLKRQSDSSYEIAYQPASANVPHSVTTKSPSNEPSASLSSGTPPNKTPDTPTQNPLSDPSPTELPGSHIVPTPGTTITIY